MASEAGGEGRVMGTLPVVVFDFDGVLVDSEPMHEAALRRACEAVGMGFTTEAYYARYVGLDDRDCFAALLKDHGRPAEAGVLGELSRRKREGIEAAMAHGEPRAVPGAVELVRSLVGRAALGVCSGSLPHEIHPVLEGLGIAGCFGAVVTAADVARAKPDPAGYRLTLERLGARVGTAIEDTPRGVEAAKGAGMWVVAVGTTRPREELARADRFAERLGEVSVEWLLRR